MKTTTLNPSRLVIYTTVIFLSLSTACTQTPTVQKQEHDTAPITEQKEAPEKSKIDQAVAVINTASAVVNTIIEKKAKTDSIFFANTKNEYAFQLGFNLSTEDQVLEAAAKLSSLDNVVAVKVAKHDYILLYYQEFDPFTINDQLEEFKLTHASEVRGTITKLNLTKLCGPKKHLQKTFTIKKRKNNTVLDCLECAK